MTYRDPNEALRAENESLQQQLRDAQAEAEQLRARAGATDDETERQRFAFGMRFMGGVALMLPFLLMTSMCERRFMPRYHPSPMGMATVVHYDPVPAVNVPHPFVSHTCQMRAQALTGFEGFTRSVERSARVVSAENVPGLEAGASCTVRIAPVTLQNFNCHAEVVCNGQTVYGTLPTGYAHCDVDRGLLLRATDSDVSSGDGDPAINLDLAAHRAVITDQRNGTTTRLSLAIDVPPQLD